MNISPISPVPEKPIKLIFDTNIWLDWFVFAQKEGTPMAQAKAVFEQYAHDFQILISPEMLEELADVLGRAQFAIAPERGAQILDATQKMCVIMHEPPTPRQRIRCADVDDQIFIDAAMAFQVHWLVSKDKHLLRLRNRARAWRVHVATPEQWCEQLLHLTQSWG